MLTCAPACKLWRDAGGVRATPLVRTQLLKVMLLRRASNSRVVCPTVAGGGEAALAIFGDHLYV